MVIAIAAIDKNNGIGYNGDLLVHIPEDLKYFSKITSNSIVVMGRKTYESLPVRPLHNRLNIVISNHINDNCFKEMDDGSIWMNIYNVKIFIKWQNMFKSILPKDDNFNSNNIFIIGGASIYSQLLNICDQLYLTEIDYEFKNIDTYFPDFKDTFKIKSKSEIHKYQNYKFNFCIYEKG